MEKPPSSKDPALFHHFCHDIRIHFPIFFLWPLSPSHSYWAHDYPELRLTNSSTPSQPDRTTLNDSMTGPKFLTFSSSISLRTILMGSNTTLTNTQLGKKKIYACLVLSKRKLQVIWHWCGQQSPQNWNNHTCY